MLTRFRRPPSRGHARRRQLTLPRNSNHPNQPHRTTGRRDEEGRGQTRPAAPHDVSAPDYDSPDRESPPRGVARVAVDRMDPSGVALLARDLLDLLDWSRSEERGKRV